jgi:phage terminase large subunit-like protein
VHADAESWITPSQWSALRCADTWPAKGAAIALGFDGSNSDDATALVGVTMDDPAHVFTLGVWERPLDDIGTWEVDRVEVAQAFDVTFKSWRVQRLLADPWLWREELGRLANRHGDDVVLEFPTNQYRRMARAVDRFEQAVRSGQLCHDGNEDLTRHIGNAKTEPVNPRRPDDGHIIRKDRKGSPRKVDGAVAAVLAFEARGQLLADGWKPRGRVRLINLNAVN